MNKYDKFIDSISKNLSIATGIPIQEITKKYTTCGQSHSAYYTKKYLQLIDSIRKSFYLNLFKNKKSINVYVRPGIDPNRSLIFGSYPNFENPPDKYNYYMEC